jgi:hypothetical protein
LLDVTETPKARLAALIEQAIEGRTYQEAVDWLLIEVAKDRVALDVMLEPYRRQAARDAIGITVRTQRHRIWNSGGNAVSRDANRDTQETATAAAHPGHYPRPTAPDARVAALTAGIVRAGLMDFRLHDGTPLCDADREKVLDAARHWGQKARDMSWKARWMERVAAKVKPNKTVRDCLNETALADLKKETENV